MTNWHTPLSTLESLGSTSARPGSLAGLHQARLANLGQFFTPSSLAALLWRIATPAIDAAIARSPGARVALIDTSCGSGRLLHQASPERHTLAGADIHAPSLQALAAAADKAGFDADFVEAGLETLNPKGFGVALLNPPFSLPFDSPTLRPLPCTGWGRFGPNSSAVSHAYALDQALAAADIVLAILPAGYAASRADSDKDHGRLRAVIRLPANSFAEEGTAVDVSLLVFGPVAAPRSLVRISLRSLDDPLPDFDLWCANTHERRARPLNPVAVQASEPTIIGPVTGDRACRVAHSGRKITLGMSCAWTRARVLNAVLRAPASNGDPKHRYPNGVKFAGQGALDIEAHLATDDPLASFEALLDAIREADADPIVDSGLLNHLRKRWRLRQRQRVPLRHVVKGATATLSAGDTLQGTALTNRQINPLRWGSGLVRKGETHTLTFTGQHYELTHPSTGEVWRMEEPELRSLFAVEGPTNAAAWGAAFPGRAAAYPEIERAVRGRMRAMGVHQVTNWAFQLDDIAESSIAPGVVCAQTMGCGKTRILLGLALLGGARTLIVVEAHLVAELLEQVVEIGLDPESYQVIQSPDQCALDRLRRINIITYSRLRQPVAPGAGRRTYARLLRRRLSRVLTDESHLLRNYDSDQTRAVWMLSPRSRIAATGTPIANYPRDLLGLLIWAAGDGTAAQPFGRFHPYMEPALVKSMDYAETGAQRFKDRHCQFEWVTHEFTHSGLRTGAKREIPKIRNLQAFRDWASCFLLRRTSAEPEVACRFNQPSYEVIDHQLGWDASHLSWFLRVADDFAENYKRQRKAADAGGRNVNLVTLLARLGAVTRAGTFPQYGVDGFGAFMPLTSKQRAVLDRCEALTSAGHKTIVFVDQPDNVELFVAELARRGVDAVPFHGQQTIAARTRALNQRFRRGDAPVLVATLGVTQTGLNLYCADRCLFACRDWTWKTIGQAMGRLLRPQQTQHVVFELFTLAGSLDTYMSQMVDMKRDATDAAVDLLAPELDDVEFVHLDAIIDRFVSDLADRVGMCANDYREAAKAGRLAEVA